MFKRLLSLLVLVVASMTVQAQSSFATGMSTGAPVGTYGAAGAAAQASVDQFYAVTPISSEQAHRDGQALFIICCVLLIGLIVSSLITQPKVGLILLGMTGAAAGLVVLIK